MLFSQDEIETRLAYKYRTCTNGSAPFYWVTQKLPQIYTANHATAYRYAKLQYRFAVTSGSPSMFKPEINILKN